MRIRTILRLAALAAVPLCAGCYYAVGPSVVPYQGHSLHQTGEIDVGYAPKEFPNWSAGLFLSAAQVTDSASFFEPTCYTTRAERESRQVAGCHPGIFSNAAGLELQYRRRTMRSLHPVASVALGNLTTKYYYLSLEPKRDATPAQSSPFVTLRGGGEFSPVSWLHVDVLAGYREVFRKSSLERTVSNSGLTLTSLLVLGKRYRNP